MPVSLSRIKGTILLLALPVSLLAQTSLSTLRGTVTDQSGAVVPGVEVTAEEAGTNVRARTVTTDHLGNFEMPDLQRGTYRVRAVMKGFKTFVAENIPLESSQIKRVDIVLQVGETGTEVTVSGAAPVIETEEGKIGAEFTAQQYKDIPIPGNSYSSPIPVLATMAQMQTDEGSYNLYFAGQGYPQQAMGMDGVNEETTNTQTVNMESVEELKVVAVNNSAEFSRVGYFNVVNKRGGNQFHGEASYYHRNSALGARGFFEPEKTHVLYHTFNLAGSGPIIKNKTFFYALWNAERVPGGAFHLTNVPTNQMRTGDFSEFLALSSPLAITDPLNNGVPFPGNVIPPQRLNGIATKAQNEYMPTPNLGGAHDLANNFGFVWPYPDDQYHADVVVTRLDHRFSDKNTLFGRFSAYLPRYVLVGNYPKLFWTRLRQSHSWAIVDTHVFSPSVVNTLTYGGNRDRVSDGETVAGYKPILGDKAVADLGITGVNPKGLSAMGFPVMDIAGYCGTCVYAGTLNVGYGGGVTQLTRNFTYGDSLSWAAGKHVWKFGAELRTYRNFDGSVPQNTYGYFTFDGSMTGNAYADFLLGLPQNTQRLDPLIKRVLGEKELGLFVTDTFKLTSRLTLDYGLRWEWFGSPFYADGLQYNWDPATGNVIVPSKALSQVSPLYPSTIKVVAGQVVPNTDKGDFRPRIAAAYRLTPTTVIRGGYGIFTEVRGGANGLVGPDGVLAQSGGPFAIGETYYNTIQNATPLVTLSSPFPSISDVSIPSQSVTGYPASTHHGLIHQFNVTVERQIKDTGLRLSYVGARDRGMDYFLEIDKPQPSLIPFTDSRRPFAQFVSTTWNRANGDSNYNSLSFEAQRRVGHLTFDSSWTWARNMVNYLNTENPYAPLFWNRDTNPKHRVVLNLAYDLPFGKGERFLNTVPGAVNQVISGWKLYWVGFLQTGHYFSPAYSGSDQSNTNTFGGLPDRIGNGNFPTDKRSLYQWFDVSAFAIPPAGRFGNSGVNILEGPGLNSHNVTLLKQFRITERWRFTLQAMAANVFNHPNFYTPPSDITIPGEVGVIGAGGGQHGFFTAEKSGARMIELRGRIEF